MQKAIELLAPAGGMEQLKAAVYNGADAVYFGGERFSARSKANNFTRKDLLLARRITQKNGVRMYCAINTLLFDDELEEALEYIGYLEKVGIDALIIQDIGLLSLVRKHFPGMEIHSSTQMSIQNHFGLEFLKGMGVKRAVLPRETSLEDLKGMKDLGIELEVFVHGAICISFSGQCLMSSMIGGRSGNRGACAQPCRLQYQLIDHKTGEKLVEDTAAFLSPKDLMLINSMGELIDAGITSFKIEGRMKTPEYVATIVKHYRKAIDSVLAGEELNLKPEDNKEIAQVFSRDFTEGYLKGNSEKELMNVHKPNNRGVLLGRVIQARGGQAEIRLSGFLEVGDKISVWTTKEGRVNSTVDRIRKEGQEVRSGDPGEIVVLDIPKRVNRDDRVFRLESAKLTRMIQEEIETHEGEEQCVLDAWVEGTVGKPLVINWRTEDGLETTTTSENPMEEAIKHPLTEESFREQMRFGETDYMLGMVSFDAGSIMVPKSTLNHLRRSAVENLDVLRKASLDHLPIRITQYQGNRKDAGSKKSISVMVETLEKLELLKDAPVEWIIYPLMNYKHLGIKTDEFVDYLQKQAGSDWLGKLVIELPRIIREEEIGKVEENLRKVLPYVGTFRAHTVDEIMLLRHHGVTRIHGDGTLNVTNHATFDYFRNVLGCEVLEYSKELNLAQLKGMSPYGQLEIFGLVELMILEHCIIGTEIGKGHCKDRIYALKDRKEIEFPILIDRLGKNHIINSKTLMLLEELKVLLDFGYKELYLNMVYRNPLEMMAVLTVYQGLIQGNLPVEKGVDQLKGLIGNYTKGHYNRGVR